ncbi:hypothetical protein Q7P37_010585 [Cladosporium fusiforme]
MYSMASMIHGMASQRPGSSNINRTTEHSRSPSPVFSRRHRRSYTISAPLGTRVNAFPSPLGVPPTPPRNSSPISGKENASPRRPASSNSAPLLTTSKKSKEPDSSPATPKRPRIFHTTSIFNDRFLDLPPLPETWTTQHDRAICVLDSRNYSPTAIVAKLRRVFPRAQRNADTLDDRQAPEDPGPEHRARLLAPQQPGYLHAPESKSRNS